MTSVPTTPAECKTIVDGLDAEAFEIRERVETVNVVGYDGETMWMIASFRLSNAGPDEA